MKKFDMLCDKAFKACHELQQKIYVMSFVRGIISSQLHRIFSEPPVRTDTEMRREEKLASSNESNIHVHLAASVVESAIQSGLAKAAQAQRPCAKAALASALVRRSVRSGIAGAVAAASAGPIESEARTARHMSTPERVDNVNHLASSDSLPMPADECPPQHFSAADAELRAQVAALRKTLVMMLDEYQREDRRLRPSARDQSFAEASTGQRVLDCMDRIKLRVVQDCQVRGSPPGLASEAHALRAYIKTYRAERAVLERDIDCVRRALKSVDDIRTQTIQLRARQPASTDEV